ncbi:MAG: DUF3486 family protein [Oscillospiraceae bacterium]|jgi:hypothetical protein|nr:DUF3486 family protein [Oscillospiraceae bacterium]
MAHKNRKHSIIDELDPALKDTVEQMLLAGATYSEIVTYLKSHDVGISLSSVCRYARRLTGDLQELSIINENMRRMMEELDKYPQLDTTEVLIRLASQNVFNALSSASEEDWQNVKLDKMLRESTALIRATAYKRRTEMQNQETTEAGLEAVKSLIFEAMAKERPELYKQVSAFLSEKKQSGI